MQLNRLSKYWQKLPRSESRALQAEKLRHYLRNTVMHFSPHYRELFHAHNLDLSAIRTLEDLHRIPFTTKADLLPDAEHPDRFKEFLVSPQRESFAQRLHLASRAAIHGRRQLERLLNTEYRPVMMFFTTGRAAEPLPFLLTNHDIANLQLASRRLMEVCGARPEFRMLNAFPFAPHLAFWFTHYAGISFGVLNVSSGGGKVAGSEGNLRLIQKLKPDVIIGMPTFIYHLLQQAAEQDVRCPNLKRIVVGGEKVSDGLRRKLRELAAVLGAKNPDVLATYGFTEAKLAWAECPYPHDQPSSGYHLYPDLGIIEVIDPATGMVVPPNHPGEIVFTPLDARGTVVLRYRTGDYIDGGLTYEPCPYCGGTMPRLLGNISRASQIREMHLDKLKGTLVDFNQLEHVLDDAPHVGTWQLELRKANDDPLELDELILHVQKTDSTHDRQLIRELNERFHGRTEIHPNRIVFHDAGEMRRLLGVGVLLKEEKIVDHRPPQGGDTAGRSSPAAAAGATVIAQHLPPHYES